LEVLHGVPPDLRVASGVRHPPPGRIVKLDEEDRYDADRAARETRRNSLTASVELEETLLPQLICRSRGDDHLAEVLFCLVTTSGRLGDETQNELR
jgi:hypothetical protein